MITLLLFICLPFHSSASVFVRIASLKYNTFLGVDAGKRLVIIEDINQSQDSNLPNTSYTWILRGQYISTLDSAVYLGIHNNIPELSNTKAKWNYDRNNMNLYLESGEGYLIMNDTSVSLQRGPDKYNNMIMFPVAQSGGKQIEQSYIKKIKKVEDEQHNLELAIKKTYKITDQFFKDMKQLKLEIKSNLSDAGDKIKEMNEMTVKIVKDTEALLAMEQATIAKTNNTLTQMRSVAIPDLRTKWGDLQYVPQALINNAQTKLDAMLLMIENDTVIFNTSVTDLVDSHRIMPQGSYDWFVISIIVCYLIYFVDVFLRVSKPRIGKPKSNLTMEMEQQYDETPGIAPEYYLTEESVAGSKGVIQGQLKLHT